MIRRTLLALVLLTLALPAAAQASSTQEATFQDDNLLIYTDDASRAANLDLLQSLGVDRLRLTVLWAAIAPDPQSRTKPPVGNDRTNAPFDAANPDTYGALVWHNYDEVVKGALARGMAVNLNVTGPSPLWANQTPPRPDVADTYEPSPAEFNAFVSAVGKRYSGTYADPAGGTLPRVDYWSIWNEPNQSGWLTPNWQKSGKRWYERSASLYRELLDQAWGALGATGHGQDTILIGETAPAGNDSKEIKRQMTPLTFIRALYCVDRKGKRLKGVRAKLLTCAKTSKAFKRAHPALFAARGFAHHPYQLLLPPGIKPKNRNQVTIAALPRLTTMLDRTMRLYRSKTRYPLYLTEFGYQTPPDRFGVPLRFQGQFLNQSEYIASRNSRVKTLAQFLLNDDGDPIGTTFQSGLRTHAGAPKPSLAAYRLPVFVTGKGSRKRVWGVVRPTAPNAKARVKVQFRRNGTSRWRTVKTVTATGKRNVFRTSVTLRGRGDLRVAALGVVSRTDRVF